MKIVQKRDLWCTPPSVAQAPLALFGRSHYDYDLAGSRRQTHLPVHEVLHPPLWDALSTPWPWGLCWLNTPFSKEGGTKRRWAMRAIAQVELARQTIVCYYNPVYADTYADYLTAEATAVIRVGGGRVNHLAPRGVKLKGGSPERYAHNIWLLCSPDIAATWTFPRIMVWDHKNWTWIKGPGHD